MYLNQCEYKNGDTQADLYIMSLKARKIFHGW